MLISGCGLVHDGVIDNILIICSILSMMESLFMESLRKECAATGLDNVTPLHYAAEKGSTDVVKYLINDCNCDPMATNWYHETVLHIAVKHIDIVKYLVTECGCDPMTTDNGNRTTLHHAARDGSTDVIKYLIHDCNCDPMSVDGGRWTPLHWAVRFNNSDAVEYLLSTGKCDPLARDRDGDTPMKL